MTSQQLKNKARSNKFRAVFFGGYRKIIILTEISEATFVYAEKDSLLIVSLISHIFRNNWMYFI